ncbi:MAG: hypothetical protein GQ542_01545 [Desulforhopalus sp.]|nr:hypothetical protein [Desulforhopalus sp.]
MTPNYHIIDTTLREGEQIPGGNLFPDREKAYPRQFGPDWRNRGRTWGLLKTASLLWAAHQLLQDKPSKAETVALEPLQRSRHHPRHTACALISSHSLSLFLIFICKTACRKIAVGLKKQWR